MMASADKFSIVITGRGGHGAFPHLTIDPVLVAAHVVTGLQSLVSRSVNPLEAAVVSVTTVNGGTAFNVIPESVTMSGTARCFSPQVRDLLDAGINRIAAATAAAFGATASVDYQRRYPPLVNSAREVGHAASAATAIVGAENVDANFPPVMGAEDFAFMLEARPGAYIFLGASGDSDPCMIHNPRYDFNDQLLPIGASYWAELVESLLPLVPA
jgi:hippurate hydrolase